MFDTFVRNVEHHAYITQGIERGWFPANLVELVTSSMETLLKNCRFQDLPNALEVTSGSLTVEFDSLIPQDYAVPLTDGEKADLNTRIKETSPRITLRHPLSRSYKRVLASKAVLEKSTNPYERLELLKVIATSQRNLISLLDEFFWYTWTGDTQSAIVGEALPIAGLQALRGRPNDAILLLEELMDEGYVSWDSRKNALVSAIGYIQLLKGDLIRAECSFKEVQRRNVWYVEGEYGALLYNHRVGMILLQNGELERARKAFERVSSFLPQEKSPQYVENYQRVLAFAAAKVSGGK